ncbi:MAG: GtrA family protein [Clostridia bacterium]|nr:GtrA family protein [Clostridia bacterium]
MENTKAKEIFRAFKFLLISISAGLVELGTFTLFNELLRFDYWICYLLSVVLSVLWNFTINRKVTFRSANNIKIAMLLVFAFYVVFVPCSTLVGNYATGLGVNEYIVKIATMLLNFTLEFVYCRFVVYRNSCDTAVKKDKRG